MKLFCLSICLLAVGALHAQQDTLLCKSYHWNELKPVQEPTSLRRQVLEGKTHALKHFEVHATTLEPGKAPHPPHMHANEDELIIVKEGQVQVNINGKLQVVGAGSIAFIKPGDPHGVNNAGKTQAVYYILKYGGRVPTDSGSTFILDRTALTQKPTDKGYRVDYFNKGTAQVKQFEMHTTALNVGEMSHPPHTHVQEEVILVIRGNVEMNLGKETARGTTGDLFFVSSTVPHNLRNIGAEQCEYFAFQWRN